MARTINDKPNNGFLHLVAYIALIIGGILVFLLIQRVGTSQLAAPPPLTASDTFPGDNGIVQVDEFFHLLLALFAVIVVGWGLGLVFKKFHQPPVIGEVIAGIILGPSLLGWIAPQAQAFLFPSEIEPYLQAIAQLGVILYMFLVGLELNPAMLRDRSDVAIGISHAGIVIPFLLGAAFALYAYPELSTNDVPFSIFALFLGVSLSVTAFPVLARILTDRGLSRTKLGVIALACASIDDVTAWCLLAIVVGVAQAQVNSAIITIGLTVLYILLMLRVAQPLMKRLINSSEKEEKVTRGIVAAIFLCVLLSSLMTELIGIHALFGAFLIGAIIPHSSRVAREFTRNLQDIVGILLLPAFFAFTGLRTQIGLVTGAQEILICIVIILLATVGKFLGGMLTARVFKIPWRDSAALGILMNTRGLIELIVLNIGLELNVISPTLFTMLVIMSIVTTISTTPVLDMLIRTGRLTLISKTDPNLSERELDEPESGPRLAEAEAHSMEI